MPDLRDLIIDLRIQLRQLKPDFQKSELRQRMDEAVSMLGRLPDASLEGILRASGAPRSMADLAPAPVPAAAITVSEPTPVDPQILMWREVVHDLRATHPAVYEMIRREVDARLGVVPAPADEAGAAPLAPDGAAPILAPAPPSSLLAESSSDVPSETILKLVADGLHTLTDGQREWCMGEAMVLLGFQLSPDELLGRGDQALAQVILTGALE